MLKKYALASFGFGFRRLKIIRNDKEILCIRQNHVFVEFHQTTASCIGFHIDTECFGYDKMAAW